jgi:hypothetical protein
VTACNFELGAAPVLVGAGADAGSGIWSASLATPSVTPGTYAARARVLSSRGLYGYSADVSVTVSALTAIQRLAQLCPGLCLWVGDGSGTYVQIDAGNSEAGDQIDRWWDQSASGADAEQDTDIYQPTLRTQVTQPELLYTLSSDRMATGLSLSARTQVTQYAVFRVPLGAASNAFARTASTFFWNTAWTGSAIASTAGRWTGSAYESGTGTFSKTGLAGGGYHCLCTAYDGTQTGNANRLKLEWDTAAQSLSFGGTVPASLDTGAGVLSLYGPTGMQLVALYAGVHTPAERAEVYAILRHLCPDWTA